MEMKDDKKTWTIKACFCGVKLKCFTWFCVFSIKNILEIYMDLETMHTTQIIIIYFTLQQESASAMCAQLAQSQNGNYDT